MASQPHNNNLYTLVCVDSVENGVVSGRFYHGGLDSERTFRSTTQFLLDMDRILSGGVCPVSSDSAGSIWYTGKIATFKLRVMFRQNASWQGSVMWLETRHEVKFRSALELLSIFHQTLVPSQERRMRPSSLRIAK